MIFCRERRSVQVAIIPLIVTCPMEVPHPSCGFTLLSLHKPVGATQTHQKFPFLFDSQRVKRTAKSSKGRTLNKNQK